MDISFVESQVARLRDELAPLGVSGALGPMVAARPADRIEVRIEGLRSVRVGFAA